MKTVAILLPRTVATSYIHNGIRCAISKRHYTTKHFVPDNEKAMNEKLFQAREDALKAKEEMLKTKEEMLKAKDTMLKATYDNLCIANAELLHQQGNLSFQSVFEQFEKRCERLLDLNYSTLADGTTKREFLWTAIIENNVYGIKQHLGDTSTDWPAVAQALHKVVSEDTHKKSKKDVNNNTTVVRPLNDDSRRG